MANAAIAASFVASTLESCNTSRTWATLAAMNTVILSYGAFCCACVAAFSVAKADRAAFLMFFGGWLTLPVATFRPSDVHTEFPYWITGLAVPSDILIDKAWVVPVAVLLCLLWRLPDRFFRLRLSLFDLPMIAFCAWPGLQALVVDHANPAGVIATAYLAGSWGASWMIGRIVVDDDATRRRLVNAIAWSGIACAPIAIAEGVIGPKLYGWIYGLHPFRDDGAVRYLGFRPIGFFEHGNQYGLWVAMAAIAGTWLARRDGRTVAVLGGLVTWAICLASQSVMAVALALAGSVALLFPIRLTKIIVFAACAATLLAGVLHVSGFVPVRQLVESTSIGQWSLDAFRAAGRGSFPWRIAQDLKALPLLKNSFVMGTGQWDWWRPLEGRPWGLWMLLLGQFGLVGAAWGAAAWAGTALARIVTIHRETGGSSLVLAIIALAAFADSLFNSFIYFPALLAAGGIVAGMPRAGKTNA
ncbi:MAG: hypothetical protein U1E46_15905 [Hyphomicrobiales bacterium]